MSGWKGAKCAGEPVDRGCGFIHGLTKRERQALDAIRQSRFGRLRTLRVAQKVDPWPTLGGCPMAHGHAVSDILSVLAFRGLVTRKVLADRGLCEWELTSNSGTGDEQG